VKPIYKTTFVLLAASYCTVCFCVYSQDSVPKLIDYQGRLTDAGGQPLSNGVYSVRFELFDTFSLNSSLIWGRTYSTTVLGGQFNVVLGSAGGVSASNAAANDLSFAFTSPNRFLQLTVLTDGSGTNLLPTPIVNSPRQQMFSAPFSLKSENGNPPGAISAFPGNGAMAGWELCDGTARNGSDPKYAPLFAVIAKQYGTGDGGSNSFNLPDLRGRFVLGAGTGTNLSNRSLAATGGHEQLTLSVGNLPPHHHGINLTTDSSAVHNHQITVPDQLSLLNEFVISYNVRNVSTATASGPAHTHGVTGDTQDNGSGGVTNMANVPVDNMPPFLVLGFYIKL
jgi:microcystin-dependent protein